MPGDMRLAKVLDLFRTRPGIVPTGQVVRISVSIRRRRKWERENRTDEVEEG